MRVETAFMMVSKFFFMQNDLIRNLNPEAHPWTV